jgi:hypothetical protein
MGSSPRHPALPPARPAPAPAGAAHVRLGGRRVWRLQRAVQRRLADPQRQLLQQPRGPSGPGAVHCQKAARQQVGGRGAGPAAPELPLPPCTLPRRRSCAQAPARHTAAGAAVPGCWAPPPAPSSRPMPLPQALPDAGLLAVRAHQLYASVWAVGRLQRALRAGQPHAAADLLVQPGLHRLPGSLWVLLLLLLLLLLLAACCCCCTCCVLQRAWHLVQCAL